MRFIIGLDSSSARRQSQGEFAARTECEMELGPGGPEQPELTLDSVVAARARAILAAKWFRTVVGTVVPVPREAVIS
jgi:hypothetical protein